MTRILEEKYYDGAKEKIGRLGLDSLIGEIRAALQSFELLIRKQHQANGTAVLREMLDNALKDVGDWTNAASGDVDWIKCKLINGTRVCVGVEVQMSARSDLIFRDIVHFQKQLREGHIDVCVEILPADEMSYYLTDRTPCFSDGVRVIEEMLVHDLPIVLMAIGNDGWTEQPLAKKKTNLGEGKKKRGNPLFP